MPDWHAVFVPSTPVLEIFLRGTITFLVLMAMLRAAGQREAGGLGITDVFLVVLVAEAVAPGLVGENHSVADGVMLAATVIFWSLVLDAVAYRWPRLGRFIKARPRLLIKEGRLNHKVMRRELMTRSEVTVQLRLLVGVAGHDRVLSRRVSPISIGFIGGEGQAARRGSQSWPVTRTWIGVIVDV